MSGVPSIEQPIDVASARDQGKPGSDVPNADGLAECSQAARDATSPVLIHIVELGDETLNCLRRLTALLERQGDQAPTLTQHGSVPAADTIYRPKESPYLNAEEAAFYLGTTLKSLYGLVERKRIEPLRGPRRRYRFTQEMLNDYLKRDKKR